MWKENNPDCPCCEEGCVCAIDSFTDSVTVSDADETVLSVPLHLQKPYPTWLRAEVKMSAGTIGRLFFVWDDSSPGDGLYVEFTPQSGSTKGTLALYQKDGTQVGATLDLVCAATGLWHNISICYDPITDEVNVVFDARDSRDTVGFVIANQTITETIPAGLVAGKKAGYGTGSGHSGNLEFKNYYYERLWYVLDASGGTCAEDCAEPYYALEPDHVCGTCGTCEIVDEDFSDFADGDMGCAWDVGATNWAIASEEAIGDGTVTHEFDVSRGVYDVVVTCSVGELATDGDSVTMSIDGKSATLTRNAVDDYTLSFIPATISPINYSSAMTAIKLHRCARFFCASRSYFDPGGDYFSPLPGVGVDLLVGPLTVGITQPTMSGGVDSAMTRIVITKSKEMDITCPDCSCVTVCNDCLRSEWPTGLIAEIVGLEEQESRGTGTLIPEDPPDPTDCSYFSSGCFEFGAQDDVTYDTETVRRAIEYGATCESYYIHDQVMSVQMLPDVDDYNRAFYLARSDCSASFSDSPDFVTPVAVTFGGLGYANEENCGAGMEHLNPCTMGGVQVTSRTVYASMEKGGITVANLKGGWSWNANHYYLSARLTVNLIYYSFVDYINDDPDVPANWIISTLTWYQYWSKDLGDTEPDCMIWQEEELEWIGYNVSGVASGAANKLPLYRRWFGGGRRASDLGGQGDAGYVASSSIVKVSSI